MTAMSQVKDRVAYAIGKAGQPATLVRLAGRTGTRHELPIKAVPVFMAPSAPTGSVVQEVYEMRIGDNEIAASTWPAPIKRGDQIIMAGVTYTIQSIRTAAPGGTTAIHFLQVMGQA